MIIRSYHLRCDTCDTVYDLSMAATETAAQQRRAARRVGWTVSRPGGTDYCSDECATPADHTGGDQ